jgi:hypothetical protein
VHLSLTNGTVDWVSRPSWSLSEGISEDCT